MAATKLKADVSWRPAVSDAPDGALSEALPMGLFMAPMKNMKMKIRLTFSDRFMTPTFSQMRLLIFLKCRVYRYDAILDRLLNVLKNVKNPSQKC